MKFSLSFCHRIRLKKTFVTCALKILVSDDLERIGPNAFLQDWRSRLELSRSSFTRLFFLETVNEMIFRSVDGKVKRAGFEGFHNFTHGPIRFTGARFFERGRLLERVFIRRGRSLGEGVHWRGGVYWEGGVYWKGGVHWRGAFIKYFYELRGRLLERGVY